MANKWKVVVVCTVESGFLKPSVFQISQELEPEVISSSQSNAVINFFRHLLKTHIFQTSVSFPWRFKESEFLCSLVEMDNMFNMKRGRSAFKVLQKTGLKMLL